MTLIYGTTADEYDATPGLRRSTIQAMLKNPAKWRHDQANPREKRHFTVGSAVHAMTLDHVTPTLLNIEDWKAMGDDDRTAWITQASPVVHVLVENWKTKAAQEAHAELLAAGRYPLSTPEALQAQAMHQALTTNPHIARHLAAGQTEVTVTGIDRGTFTPLKARLDIVDVDARTIIDIKTTVDADPHEFGTHAARHGYHMQDAHYVDLTAHATGTDPDEWRFLFVQVEKGDTHTLNADGSRHQSYHGTSAVQLDAAARRRGREDLRKGIARYLQAERTGHWSGYPTDIVPASLPRWY